MNGNMKKTPLHSWHKRNGAMVADFGGYEMPLWYSSVKNEHLAVLTHAGLFDTGHMAVLLVSGPDARNLLQYCFTNNLDGCIGPQRRPLGAGRCVYGAFLNESGGVVDDAIICQLNDQEYMVVINAGMGAGIVTHLGKFQGNLDVEIADLTDRVGKIDIQGREAVSILREVLEEPDRVFDGLPYFSFKGHFLPDGRGPGEVRFKDGTEVMLSRTGYTGEAGFEIFCDPAQTEKLWRMIMEVGRPKGMLPCGLASRDSLRAGAVLPLSHQDIGAWPFMNHPWPFALSLDSDGKSFTKSFIGAEALLHIPAIDFTYAFAGYNLRKVSISDPAVVMDGDGNPMGKVLTCVTDMGIDRHQERIFSVASPDQPAGMKFKGLCCGFVIVDRPLDPGQQIFLKDSRRTIKVEIVEDVRPDRTARKSLDEL